MGPHHVLFVYSLKQHFVTKILISCIYYEDSSEGLYHGFEWTENGISITVYTEIQI